MPYEVRQKGDEYCVYNTETGDEKACHDSKEEAEKQVRLLRGLEHGMTPREESHG